MLILLNSSLSLNFERNENKQRVQPIFLTKLARLESENPSTCRRTQKVQKFTRKDLWDDPTVPFTFISLSRQTKREFCSFTAPKNGSIGFLPCFDQSNLTLRKVKVTTVLSGQLNRSSQQWYSRFHVTCLNVKHNGYSKMHQGANIRN